MSSEQIQLIPLDKIKTAKYNVRRHDIDVGIDDLALNIKAIGLLQPITVYFNSEKKIYIILAGQRRLNAHQKLNEDYPDKGFHEIKCIVIEEPKTDEEKTSLSLAENITQVSMHNADLVKAVTDLYNVYGEYDMVQEHFGISRYMVDKYVRLARLPERLCNAIQEGEISSHPKTAENSAVRAVRALSWVKGGDVSEDDVLQLAKEYAKDEIDASALDDSAKKGGSVSEIREDAKGRTLTKHSIELSVEVAEKLKKVADSNGESEKARATSYVVKGTTKDYSELEN